MVRYNKWDKDNFIEWFDDVIQYNDRNVQSLTFIDLRIKNVIFNYPATIVFWMDGTKTVVKCGENDFFDPEKGLAMAIVKKVMGNNKGNYNNIFKKWIKEEDY